MQNECKLIHLHDRDLSCYVRIFRHVRNINPILLGSTLPPYSIRGDIPPPPPPLYHKWNLLNYRGWDQVLFIECNNTVYVLYNTFQCILKSGFILPSPVSCFPKKCIFEQKKTKKAFLHKWRHISPHFKLNGIFLFLSAHIMVANRLHAILSFLNKFQKFCHVTYFDRYVILGHVTNFWKK